MNDDENEQEDGLFYSYFIKPFEYGGDAATANATTTAEKSPMAGTPNQETATAGDDDAAAAGDDDDEETVEGDDDEEAAEGDDDEEAAEEEYVY